MSDTPETQEAVERWQQGKINIFDEMARLETERNRYKSDVEVITKERDEALEECAAMQKDAKDYIELADELDAVKRERDEAREALREIAAADWKTSGELRGMARRVLEAAK